MAASVMKSIKTWWRGKEDEKTAPQPSRPQQQQGHHHIIHNPLLHHYQQAQNLIASPSIANPFVNAFQSLLSNDLLNSAGLLSGLANFGNFDTQESLPHGQKTEDLSNLNPHLGSFIQEPELPSQFDEPLNPHEQFAQSHHNQGIDEGNEDDESMDASETEEQTHGLGPDGDSRLFDRLESRLKHGLHSEREHFTVDSTEHKPLIDYTKPKIHYHEPKHYQPKEPHYKPKHYEPKVHHPDHGIHGVDHGNDLIIPLYTDAKYSKIAHRIKPIESMQGSMESVHNPMVIRHEPSSESKIYNMKLHHRRKRQTYDDEIEREDVSGSFDLENERLRAVHPIQEVKPRSFVRWNQIMKGWNPINHDENNIKRNDERRWPDPNAPSQGSRMRLPDEVPKPLIIGGPKTEGFSPRIDDIALIEPAYSWSNYRWERISKEKKMKKKKIDDEEKQMKKDEILKKLELPMDKLPQGSVVKPVDGKQAEELVKMLSNRQEFQGKKITDVYYLEMPKQRQDAIEQIKKLIKSSELKPLKQSKLINKEIDFITSDDVNLEDNDFHVGELLCEGKLSGAYADVKKQCRIYYQCTETTIDTFICPKGTLFDDSVQLCQPADRVLCQKL